MPEAPRHQPLQKTMPALLSFVAGYVDSYTYLALFGLFVAQVTGSFVIAGAELVTRDYGIAGKLLGIVAGLIAAAAMGAQSVLVRLLMKGIPQTNVMTGNMTQLGITTTEIIMAWCRLAREPGNRALAEEFAEVRDQLLTVLSVAVGFLVGAAAGAVAFATTNVRGALLAVAIVAALALWALYREKHA